MAERRHVVVDVTDQEIQLGVRGSANNCPLAMALRRIGVGPEVYVNEDTWDRGLNTAEVPLTRKARRFVERFDAEQPVRPERFRLPWSRYLVAMTPEWHEHRARPLTPSTVGDG